MVAQPIDAKTWNWIAGLGQRVLAGGAVSREEGEALLRLEPGPALFEMLAWANRLREQHFGNRIHLCSIVNIKAGACPEDCRFCAQSSYYQTASPRHGWLADEPVLQAAGEAQRNGVRALGIVAAWKELKEGPVLDQLCGQICALAQSGRARADASLGMIKSQAVADRLKGAGLACYNHNLETSRRFFPNVCTTHTYDDRVATVRFLKQAGVQVCCGGILGMGETLADRLDLALMLRELAVDMVPLNFLNPIPGTPFEKLEPLQPMEILTTIAGFRFILPRQEIMIAGGRVVNLRDLQSLMFMAGASGLMVGNYLTTCNQPVEKDLQLLKDLQLEPLRGVRS